MNVYIEMASYYAAVYRDKIIKTSNRDYEVRNELMQSLGTQTVLSKVYKLLVFQKSILPIEDLRKEEKEKLTSAARELNVKFTNKTLILYCKMLHVINAINL